MRALHPMTDAERAFAEEWHPLVLEFLHGKKLSEADYYDVVVFGFISAVQQYVGGESPSGIEFVSMAKRAMKDAVLKEAEYQNRQKRSGITLSLDCGVGECDGLDLYGVIPSGCHDTAAQVESKVVAEAARSVATARESVIIPFVAHGYTVMETARQLGISGRAVESRLHRFRRRARAAAM